MGTFFAGDLRTGRILLRNLPAASGDCSAVVNGAGGITTKLQMPMTDPNTGVPVPVMATLGLGRSFLAYEEQGKIINAGPIWSDTYDLDAKTWEFNAAGLWSLWNYRFVMPALKDYDPTSLPMGENDTSLTGLDLRTIAKRLVQQAIAWTGGSVPLVFESDILGDSVRNYSSKDLGLLYQRLQELTSVINGPDIAFRPQFQEDPNYIQWVMRTGDPVLASANTPVWDATVPGTSISGTTVKRDGTVLLTDDYEQGDPPTSSSDDQSTDAPLTAKSVDTALTRPGELVNHNIDPNATNAGSYVQSVGGGGAGTKTAMTGTGPAGSGINTYLRCTVTTAGTYMDLRPYVGTNPLTPGATQVAYGVWAQSSKASAVTTYILWYAADGVTQVGSTVTQAQTAIAANAWTWYTMTAVPPVGAVYYTMIARATNTAAIGDTWDTTLWTALENTAVVPAAFSGATPDGADASGTFYEYAWNGPVNAGASSRWLMAGSLPRMEGKGNRSGVSILQTLQDYADGATTEGREPLETWSFGGKVDEYPTVADYDEGDYAIVKVRKDDARLGNDTGQHKLRIMQYKITLGDPFARIDCFPNREA